MHKVVSTPLVTDAGIAVGELQEVQDRFTPAYFRVLTSRRDDCRIFYYSRDVRRWLASLKLTLALARRAR